MRKPVGAAEAQKIMRRFVENEIRRSNDAEDRKFRVYDLKTGTFYPETEEFFLSSAGDRLMTKAGRELSLKDHVIQRCTGELDLKNRPIYHGDILRTDESGWEAAVVWGYGGFCLEDDRGGFSAEPDWNRCEIVGNIFSTSLRRRIDLTEEEERAMDLWYACWKGEYGGLEAMLPECRKFLNRNLEFTECGERKTLCLPLIAAVNSRSLRCIELLLENGALPHKRCKDTGETPWSFAKRTEEERLPIPEMLARAAEYRKNRR